MLHNLSIDCFVKAQRSRMCMGGLSSESVRWSRRVVGREAQEQSTPGQTDGRGTTDERTLPRKDFQVFKRASFS